MLPGRLLAPAGEGGAVGRLVFKDELLDAQLLRAVGTAIYGGADIGECLQAARQVKESDLGTWFATWRELAERTYELAQRAQQAGYRVSARDAFLRACTYFRTSGVMLFGTPVDLRLKHSNTAQTAAFRSAAELMDAPVETITIPYEGTTLPGYFLRPDDSGRPRATVVLIGGYDGTCEELYFFNGAAALARGYNVLAFDGPGQGAALLQQGLVLRPDWEAVVTPVVDYALTRPEVDPERIALIGLSLGAHLAPRAASAEHRIAALVADCGAFDLNAALLARLPGPLAAGYADGKRSARLALGAILSGLARKPTAGWALRRGQLVHGTRSALAYADSLADYTLAGRADKITCPTWVGNAENDQIGASAPDLVAALTVEHEFVRFTTAEGAGDHCEQGARALYHARSFGWLDAHLNP
jgi:alpha-beta hydrolase superfamily lysophospholipase